MKKYLVLTFFVLISVSCIKQQRKDNSEIANCNFSELYPFDIAINCEYLTEEQFNQASCDTTTMYKLDENTSLQFYNAWHRLMYELMARQNSELRMELAAKEDSIYELMVRANDEFMMRLSTKQDSIYSGEEFFLYGKLNLQPDVQSFIIFIFDKRAERMNEASPHNFLLFNIKDNQLCSIIRLVLPKIRNIDSSFVAATCVNNKIFKQIALWEEYFLFDYFGERFTKKK
jgi:hypothetical protein